MTERRYYLKGERYDWVTDPRGFEKMFHSQRVRELRRFMGSQNSITLDAGCGTGLVTRHVPGRVIACDLNVWNLDRARTRLNVDLVQCDLSNLPFRQAFDRIVSSEVLEHLSDARYVISEFKRVLKPKGRLVGSVPSRSIVWRFRSFLSRTHPHSEPFHNNFTRRDLILMLTGFSETRVRSSVFGMSWFFEARK